MRGFLRLSCSMIERYAALQYSWCVKEKLDEETHYKLLKYLEENPDISQRELAKKMGVSLGKVNYCLKALIEIGHVKLVNFANSKNKLGYMYFLTPKGVREKAKVTKQFLAIKRYQYEKIIKQIKDLEIEMKKL